MSLSRTHGAFESFGLVLRESLLDPWDLVVSASWLGPDKIESYRLMTDALQAALTRDEFLQFSRAMILEKGNPFLERVLAYERIIASGALEDPSRIELMDGYMVDKMGKKPGHSYSATATHQAFVDRLPAGWLARKEEPVRIPAYDAPVRIPAYDEPEPDISIVRGINADYRSRVLDPFDVALVFEVSDWTLGTDRGLKLMAYARAGIPVYWIVNLFDGPVEVYTRPTKAGRYRSRKDYKPGQQVPVIIAAQPLAPIAVDDILP